MRRHGPRRVQLLDSPNQSQPCVTFVPARPIPPLTRALFLKNSAVHDLRGYGLCPAPDGAARSDRQQFQLEYRCDIKRGHARDRGGGRWYVVWCAGGGVDRRSSTPRSRCMVKRGAGKRVAVAHLIIGLVAYTKHKASMDYLAYTFTLLSRT